MALLSIHQNCQLVLQVVWGAGSDLEIFHKKGHHDTFIFGRFDVGAIFENLKILLSQICTSVENT